MRSAFHDDLFDSTVYSLQVYRQRAVERALRESIMLFEGGRMPDEAEVRLHGRHLIWPDGHEEFYWKGRFAVGVAGRDDPAGEPVSQPRGRPAQQYACVEV